jgi:hypothetical protein
MIARGTLAALLVALTLPAQAPAQEAPSPRWGLTAAGDPLGLREAVDPERPPQWWTCPPGDACRHVANGTSFAPGETARGASFRTGRTSTWIEDVASPLWLGRVAATLPPALEGVAAPGGTVKLLPASWTGGWGSDVSTSAILACPSPARTDCEVLPAGAVLGKHRGWSLFAVEARGSRDMPPGPIGAVRPEPSALVSVSAPAGPVADAPPKVDVTLRARAQRSRGRVDVGRVLCAQRCRVELTVGSVRRSFSIRGSSRLSITASRVARSGRANMTVDVNGLRLVSGRVRL